jgi:AraC-like DNA-binding protein
MLYLKADVVKPFSFISCGQFVNAGWQHDKRTLDSFEVIFGVRGCAYIQQDEEKYEVTPGKALLLLPGHTHKGYRRSEEEVSFYWFHFRCTENIELLTDKAALPLLRSLTSDYYRNDARQFIVLPGFFTPAESEKLMVLMKQLLHHAYSEKAMTLTNSYLFTLLLMEFSQQAITSLSPKRVADKNGRIVSEICEWLRINLDKEYTVTELAERFSFNKDYLCRLFTRYTGMPIVKYCNALRLSRAKELLCCTGLSIKEISYVLGYRDDKYFMKLFKACENLTPSEYRSSYYLTHMNNR